MLRRPLALLSLALLWAFGLGWASSAHATQDGKSSLSIETRAATHSPSTKSITTDPVVSEFDVGLGWYFLPFSDICTTAECKRGDTSLLFHVNALVHTSRHWAFGAGAAFALLPTTIPDLDAGAQASDRFLSRAYMEFDVMARFYPWRKVTAAPRQLDIWLSPVVGLALLTDRYRSPSADDVGPLRIGAPGVTLSSPALAVRGALGLDYGISRRIFFGAQVSPGFLLFSSRPKETPFGDIATQKGPELTLAATIGLKLLFDL